MEQLSSIDQDLGEVLTRHGQTGVQRVLSLLAAAWTQAQLIRMSGPELVTTAIKAWRERPKGPGLYGGT
jgi:uncharacterized phage-associated protein